MLLALWILALAALALNAPAAVWDPGARAYLFLVGWIALWRYGWGAVHLARSVWYRAAVFPRWRRLAARLAAADEADGATAPEVFVVVTSYRVRAETTALALDATLAEAARYPGRATVVAAVVEPADVRLAKALFRRRAAASPRVRLAIARGDGSGKRDGLARALRAVARRMPRPGAVVLLQDGDAVLPPGCLAACAPLFRLMPRVAALTTDEDCVVAPARGRRCARGTVCASRSATS